MGTKGRSNLYGRGKRGEENEHITYKYARIFLSGDFDWHYNNHGKKEMNLSKDQYRSRAIAFANKVDRENHDSFTNDKKLTFKYSFKTNELVLVTKEGSVATYFIINNERWKRMKKNNEDR